MDFSQESDHIVYEYLKLQDADAWRLVWEKAVLVETKSIRSAEMARKWGITAEELMSMLYVEMIGANKLALYRDDGGSIWGWLRQYVRGYIRRANPAEKREISLEGLVSEDSDGDRDGEAEEKIAKKMSDASSGASYTAEDPAIRRREEWLLVQKCFADLFRKNPMRAYVHWLRLRMNLSSIEIKNMLGMSSAANVDQTFARALKDMKELKEKYDERI